MFPKTTLFPFPLPATPETAVTAIPRETVELDGPWSFGLDAGAAGRGLFWHEGLPAAPAGEEETVEAGRPWEYWHPGYDGIAWYERKFTVPTDWAGRQILLKFDAVSYYCECWLNGELLGHHEGAFTPFEFDVASRCRLGKKNTLVVRVNNPPLDRAVEGFRTGAPLNQSDIPIGKSGWYYNFGGIWQDVHLISLPPVAVKELRVFPAPQEESLHTDLFVCGLDPGVTHIMEVNITVREQSTGEIVLSDLLELAVLGGDAPVAHRFTLPADKLQAWSHTHPHLYVMIAEIMENGVVLDRCEQVFGYREFSIQGNRFLLNGKPVILNGFLHQGCFPRTLALPETREFAWNELCEVKRRGFNFLRIAMKPAPGWYLDMADQIGLLIMHEPPIGWIANGPRTRERCLREIRELAARDTNHPSVVLLGLFNEAFHLLGFMPEDVLQLTGEMALATREIDPSRLIIDTSGGFSRKVLAGPDTMIHDSMADGHKISRAMQPWSEEFMEIMDIHKYCPFPATSETVESYRELKAPEQLIFMAEYGAPETPPDFDMVLQEFTSDEAERGLEDWQLHRDFADSMAKRFEQSGLSTCMNGVPDFIAQVNRMTASENRQVLHAIRTNPNIGGMCFCQLSDASGELFGATDIWRRPKPLYDALTAASANPAAGLTLSRRVLLEGEQLHINANLVSDPGCTYAGRAVISLTHNGKPVDWLHLENVASTEGVVSLFNGPIKGIALTPGTWQASLRFEDVGGLVTEDAQEFQVLPKLVPQPGRVALRDVDGKLEAYLRKGGWSVDVYGNNHRDKDSPVLINMEAIPRNRGFYAELYGQLRKIVNLGGCAIIFEPEVHALYRYLFPEHIRPQPVQRTCAYTLNHPVFSGLARGRVADYFYAGMYPVKWDSGEDIVACGGEVMFGAFSMHMWTRPAEYFWGAGLYRVPLGGGNVIICHMPLAAQISTSPVAERLLVNLINYAESLIQPGGEDYLLARCIDPLPPEALD